MLPLLLYNKERPKHETWSMTKSSIMCCNLIIKVLKLRWILKHAQLASTC